MITDALIDFLNYCSTLLDNTLSFLVPSPPAWYTDAVGMLETLDTLIDGVTRWAPVGLLLTVGGTILAVRVALWSVYGVRRVASYMTFGGGAI